MPEEHAEQTCPVQRPRTSRGQQRRRQRSVFQYITILFAAALVLLLYTFMMERRQFEQKQQEDQANISDLKQESVSAVQRLKALIAENEQLKEQLAGQEQQLKDLQDRLSQLEIDYNTAEQANIFQGHTTEAMDWFWQINEAYVRGKNSLCRSLINEMGEELAGYLPDYSITDNSRPSPASRYQEIYDKVMK
ncbi:MAG: hypothetical protein HFF52_01290 [Lawsonibacter sp.]|nr:hypothetical protein [Lawsonibacter sp.]